MKMMKHAHEVVGTALYVGKNKKLIAEFGGKETELYNCEGWYVLTKDEKQIVCNKSWLRKITPRSNKVVTLTRPI